MKNLIIHESIDYSRKSFIFPLDCKDKIECSKTVLKSEHVRSINYPTTAEAYCMKPVLAALES